MAEFRSESPVYPIGVVRRLTGLTSRQIRYYEQEGLLSPMRSKGNRRLYTTSDIDRLSNIKSLLAEGLNLDGARSWLKQHRDTPGSDSVGASAASTHEPHDDSIRFGDSHVGGNLTSLFPVNHQGALTRRLQSNASWTIEESEDGGDRSPDGM